MNAERQQMCAIARDQHVDAGSDCNGEDEVVLRIAADRFDIRQHRGSIRTQALEQRPRVVQRGLIETELPLQHSDEFGDHGRWDDGVEASIDDLLDDPSGWPVRDQSGDQDIRVAEDAQRQRRSVRSSSTSRSTSSGPIPRTSARFLP